MKVVCEYFGGPLDGATEVRDWWPLDGDMCHRVFHNRYVPYRWSASRIGFEFVPRNERGPQAIEKDAARGAEEV